jgi:general secretion pathway protein J
MRSDHCKGFTLVELLISLTIIGVIVVIIFGALRIGVRAWEKGERDIESHQRRRVVLDLVKQQLASTHPYQLKRGSRRWSFFKGENKSVAFVSNIPLMPGNMAGMVYVEYAVMPAEGTDREHLLFYEKDVTVSDRVINQTDQIAEDAFVELMTDAKGIAFEYLKASRSETSEWQEAWDSVEENGLPEAVRITLKEEVEGAPIYVIARIESEARL